MTQNNLQGASQTRASLQVLSTRSSKDLKTWVYEQVRG